MTASEARKFMEIQIDEHSPEIERFNNCIISHMYMRKCAPGTKCKMTYSADLISEAGASYLKKQGFGIEYIPDSRDGDYYEISW